MNFVSWFALRDTKRRIRKKYFFLVVPIAFLAESWANGQGLRISEYDVQAGVDLPSSPKSFYDYYQQGTAIGGGVGLSLSSWWSILAVADYSWFPVDGGRYFSWLKMKGDSNSISGGTTNNIALSGLMRYYPRADHGLSIELLGGFSAIYSDVGEATADYSGFYFSQNARSYFGFSLTFGGGLGYSVSKTVDLYLEGKDCLPLLRSANANVGFSSFMVGVRIYRQ